MPQPVRSARRATTAGAAELTRVWHQTSRQRTPDRRANDGLTGSLGVGSTRCRVRTCHLLQARDSYTWGGNHDDATPHELGRWVRTGGAGDAEVIQQVLDGNTAMFELLMRRYNERVYRAARAIVRDDQEAGGRVMQQAYVNAFTHLRQFNGAAQFSTWLTRIAINESLARVRRQAQVRAFDDELSHVEPFMSTQSSPENPERRHLPASCANCWNGRSTRCPTACARSSCHERGRP